MNAGVTAMAKSSRWIAVGHSDGKVTLRDPRSHRVEHTISVHTSGVNDLDMRSDLLVTCGFGSRYGFIKIALKLILCSLTCTTNKDLAQYLLIPYLKSLIRVQ